MTKTRLREPAVAGLTDISESGSVMMFNQKSTTIRNEDN
jgi:hypothetical protein